MSDMAFMGYGVQSTWWPPRGAAQIVSRSYRIGLDRPSVEIVASPDVATLTAELEAARAENVALQEQVNVRNPQPETKCKAQPTGDPPTDCDWPTCGCDEPAMKVLDALIEMGWHEPGSELCSTRGGRGKR